jgi:uncharacterized protein GlcG (DUF336 family)
MKTTTTIKLTQEGAMTILRAALDKAQSLGLPASVAVVDDGGTCLLSGALKKRNSILLQFLRLKLAAGIAAFEQS